MKIVSIQHGDYRHAIDLLRRGEPEDYFGQRYSIEVTQNFLGTFENTIISLDAPKYEEKLGRQTLIGMPYIRPSFWIRGAGVLAAYRWGLRVLREIRKYHPDRVLIRTGNPWICTPVLRYASRRGLPTLVLMANTIPQEPIGLIDSWNRSILIRFLNGKNVSRVGNHRMVATRSLIRAGVRPEKVVSYDFPGIKTPHTFVEKSAPSASEPIRIVYAGSISEGKGVEDLFQCFRILSLRGIAFEASVFGKGPLEAYVLARSKEQNCIHIEGQRRNEEVFEAMLKSHLVIVPSRHTFAEGLPFVFTEALASRTPIVCSDHPVFTEAFADGEGVVFFPAQKAELLADQIVNTARDRSRYMHLSISTLNAFDRVTSATTFGDLIEEWLKV